MKKKILILDDKETIAKVLSIYLMSDYDVQWLPDGLQAVKWLQAGNTPDLIIYDIRMQGMRCDDFLEFIKQNEFLIHILWNLKSESRRYFPDLSSIYTLLIYKA